MENDIKKNQTIRQWCYQDSLLYNKKEYNTRIKENDE